MIQHLIQLGSRRSNTSVTNYLCLGSPTTAAGANDGYAIIKFPSSINMLCPKLKFLRRIVVLSRIKKSIELLAPAKKYTSLAH